MFAEAGLRARLLCPDTCGCDKPNSTMVLSGPRFDVCTHLSSCAFFKFVRPLERYGCGTMCREKASYNQILSAIPCKDSSTTSSGLIGYAKNFASFIKESQFTSESDGHVPDPQILLSGGCRGWLEHNLVHNKTDPNWACGGMQAGKLIGPINSPLKPLSMFCPVTCACKPGQIECPTSCAAR